MSSDILPDTQTGISVIQSSSTQLPPLGHRLLLGPLRLVNHDCSPNTQFYPIKGSHAYSVLTIRPIEPGQSITVCYTEDQSYFTDRCKCQTCQPSHPPIAPRHPIQKPYLEPVDSDEPEEKKKKKKTRRGGKRGQSDLKKEARRSNIQT
ncbi:hypothetical protein FPV67DRAFT_1427193 [Lyophyllum atratum]|nr:hypothetical protein FPV67DRAFT_1427193 [Lyophyllum atratum]